MFTNKIPLTHAETDALQSATLNQLYETALDLNEAIINAKDFGSTGLSSHQWGRIGALIKNLDETFGHSDYRIRTGRTKGYNWKGEPAPEPENPQVEAQKKRFFDTEGA